MRVVSSGTGLICGRWPTDAGLAEADDAVQDTWVRLSRSGAGDAANLGGWLTTIVARVCLNMLRAQWPPAGR